jgi:hypothetical protein
MLPRVNAPICATHDTPVSHEGRKLGLGGWGTRVPDVRAGYQSIRVACRIDCDAPAEKVDGLLAHVQKTSPVLDIISNPVAVSVTNESRRSHA